MTRSITGGLVVWSLLALFSLHASGQDATWTRTPGSGPGDWNTASNWNLGAAPTAANTARMTNGGTAQVTTASVANRLLFATAANSSAFLEVFPGGSLTLSGSTNQLGAGEGSNTVITMTGGEIDYTGTGSTDLARFGSATLNVQGGAFKLDGALRVGVFEINGQGTINLSDGLIDIGTNLSLNQGASNGGALNRQPFGEAYQTGGTMQVAGTTYVGFSSAPRGHALYELAGGAFRSGSLYIGGSDNATFRVTNATSEITLQTNMSIANNAHIEAAAGTTIRFAAPTGTLVGDLASPYFAQNIYFDNSMDIADVANVAGLENTTLVFAGGALGGANVGLFEVAATDLGATASGFSNNFMLGGLSIGDSLNIGNLKLTDKLLNGAANATPQALYVDTLTVTAGSTLDLGGLNLYYRTANIAGSIVGGSATQVPEPATWGVVLLAAAGGMFFRRRRCV